MEKILFLAERLMRSLLLFYLGSKFSHSYSYSVQAEYLFLLYYTSLSGTNFAFKGGVDRESFIRLLSASILFVLLPIFFTIFSVENSIIFLLSGLPFILTLVEWNFVRNFKQLLTSRLLILTPILIFVYFQNVIDVYVDIIYGVVFSLSGWSALILIIYYNFGKFDYQYSETQNLSYKKIIFYLFSGVLSFVVSRPEILLFWHDISLINNFIDRYRVLIFLGGFVSVIFTYFIISSSGGPVIRLRYLCFFILLSLCFHFLLLYMSIDFKLNYYDFFVVLGFSFSLVNGFLAGIALRHHFFKERFFILLCSILLFIITFMAFNNLSLSYGISSFVTFALYFKLFRLRSVLTDF